jgi:hypothetical protein
MMTLARRAGHGGRSVSRSLAIRSRRNLGLSTDGNGARSPRARLFAVALAQTDRQRAKRDKTEPSFARSAACVTAMLQPYRRCAWCNIRQFCTDRVGPLSAVQNVTHGWTTR